MVVCDCKEGSCVIVKTERDERKVEMCMLFCTVGYILRLVMFCVCRACDWSGEELAE